MLNHWYNTPAPRVLLHMPVTAAAIFAHSVRLGRPDLGARGLLMGLGASVRQFRHRAPVSRSVFRLARQLRLGPLELAQIEAQLPPLPAIATTINAAI
jgi:hypothetical protein